MNSSLFPRQTREIWMTGANLTAAPDALEPNPAVFPQFADFEGLD
jgi:hypothetical protein